MKKVIFINNIVHTTKISLMRALSKDKRWEIYSILASGKHEGNWGYKADPHWKRILLPSIRIPFFLDTFSLFINPSAFFVLKKIDPDIIIISGWDLPVYHLAFIYAKLFRKRIILWTGSTKFEKSWLRTVTLPLVKYIVRNVDAIVTYGSRSRDYCLMLGAKKEKVVVGTYGGDMGFFDLCLKKFSGRRNELREKDGLPLNKMTFLYVGQLIRRKNIITLIEAFKCHSDKAVLLLVGEGKQKKELMEKVTKENIPNIYFLGSKQGEDLVKMFILSDIFILPSYQEVWGLVVNEAMAAGLPVIISSTAGASEDLVIEGINGFVFDPGNTAELKKHMKYFLDNPERAGKMGEESKALIKKSTPAVMAEAFLKTMTLVLALTDVINEVNFPV